MYAHRGLMAVFTCTSLWILSSVQFSLAINGDITALFHLSFLKWFFSFLISLFFFIPEASDVLFFLCLLGHCHVVFTFSYNCYMSTDVRCVSLCLVSCFWKITWILTVYTFTFVTLVVLLCVFVCERLRS